MADVALSEPWLGILPIALYGSPDLRDELLPRYMSGRLLPAFALSEPDAGSDAAAITTTASRDGNHYVINVSVVRDFETGGGVNQERVWRIMVDVTRLVCGEATDGFGWSCV